MAEFAEVVGGVVINVAVAASSADLPSGTWVQIDTLSLVPGIGWAASQSGGVWSFTAPAAPALTLAQQAQALLAGGLALTSTGDAALDATYALDPATISYIGNEMMSLVKNATFADGTTTVVWPDVGGTLHTFSVTQFEAFATECGLVVAGARKCIIGVPGATLPASSATIP